MILYAVEYLTLGLLAALLVAKAAGPRPGQDNDNIALMGIVLLWPAAAIFLLLYVLGGLIKWVANR